MSRSPNCAVCRRSEPMGRRPNPEVDYKFARKSEFDQMLTVELSLRSRAFQVLLLRNVAVNFVLNVIFQWGAASKWGQKPVKEWGDMTAEEVAGDLAVTGLLLGLLCSIFASMDIEKELSSGSIQRLKPTEVQRSWWGRWTPAAVSSNLIRSLLIGLLLSSFLGGSLHVIAHFHLLDLSMSHILYVPLKGAVASLLSPPVVLTNWLAILGQPVAADDRGGRKDSNKTE